MGPRDHRLKLLKLLAKINLSSLFFGGWECFSVALAGLKLMILPPQAPEYLGLQVWATTPFLCLSQVFSHSDGGDLPSSPGAVVVIDQARRTRWRGVGFPCTRWPALTAGRAQGTWFPPAALKLSMMVGGFSYAVVIISLGVLAHP
jgi:hypothetical protein